MNIAIIAGGYSSEREISLRGAEHLYSILDKTKFTPYIIDIKKNEWIATENDSIVDRNDFSITHNNNKIKFDYALIVIHGTPGENGILQSYFELTGIPYSSPGICASAVTFDKHYTKRIVEETGVKLAKDYLVYMGDKIDADAIVEKLSLPLFVKPACAGSSFGITKVKQKHELNDALNCAFKEDTKVLIEEAITGIEVSCGIMITDDTTILFPATEIVSKTEFFDYEAKYEGKSEEITPARISSKVRKELDEILVKLYKHLSLKGLVRVDFIIQDETPYMIEINTVPGMSYQSIIPQQAKEAGMTMKDLFTKVIESSCNKIN